VTSLLECRDLVRTYHTEAGNVLALQGVSFSVEASELVVLMGPSGSGKSTILSIVAGLDQPDSGTVLIDGRSLQSASEDERSSRRRRDIGLVHQKVNLVSVLTAAENVALPLELDGVSKKAARSAARELLAEVGLAAAADRRPSQLSGGQQQRVAIARGLIGPRRLLLADEPTGALDTVTGDGVIKLLKERCALGAGCLLVTHETRYAAWADRVLFLRDGAVVDDVRARPAAR
jgi:putative ABC transport system ATP-binding protein